MSEKRRVSEKISNFNLKNILRYLIRNNEGVTRSELCKNLHVSFPAVTFNLKKLMEQGLVTEEDIQLENSTIGRNPKIIKLNEKYGIIVSIHIGYKIVEILFLNTKADVIYKNDFEIPKNISFSELNEMLAQKVNKNASLCDFKNGAENILAVAVALPGIIDKEKLKLISSKFYNWQNIELPEYMKINDSKTNIYWENDSNVLARGIFYKNPELDNILAFYMGVGIGIGIIINKKLYTGSRGMAGEMGNITFPMREKTVNLEQFISEESLIKFAKENMNIEEKEHHKILREMDKRIDDEKLRENFEVISNYVGIFFALIARAFDPQKIVFDGTIVRNCPNLSHMITGKLRNFTDVKEDQVYIVDGNETTMVKGLYAIAIDKSLDLEFFNE